MAPNHDLTSVILRGVGKFVMLSRNSEVGLIPSEVTLNPKNVTSVDPN